MTLIRNVVLAVALLLAVAWLGTRAVGYVRGRTTGAIALGAVLILFFGGNLQDPGAEQMTQSQQPTRKGDEDGDKPRDDELT